MQVCRLRYRIELDMVRKLESPMKMDGNKIKFMKMDSP